jgi:Putative peptidoglycan binding domain
MKTSLRLFCIVSIAGALAVTPAAFAKKPKKGDQSAAGPGSGGPPGQQSNEGGRQRKQGGSTGPQSGAPMQGSPDFRLVVPLPPPPPPPPRYYHGSSRVYRSSSYSGDATVVQVQSALKTRGYYTGAIDGDAGSGTRAAIRAFRQEHRLEPSSAIDSSLLRALGL